MPAEPAIRFPVLPAIPRGFPVERGPDAALLVAVRTQLGRSNQGGIKGADWLQSFIPHLRWWREAPRHPAPEGSSSNVGYPVSAPHTAHPFVLDVGECRMAQTVRMPPCGTRVENEAPRASELASAPAHDLCRVNSLRALSGPAAMERRGR
jgi:hypothetical protein